MKTQQQVNRAAADGGPTELALVLAQAEQDRARVARLIHDGLAQKLTVAGMELSLWKSELQSAPTISAASVEAKILALTELLHGAISDAREVTTALYPRILESFGVGAALESVTKNASRRLGIQSRFVTENEARGVDATIGIQLVRLMEAILHDIRPSSGSVLTVEVSTRGPNVELRLHCEGTKFFVPAETAARVRAFGGAVSNKKGQGTLVVTLPACFNFSVEPVR